MKNYKMMALSILGLLCSNDPIFSQGMSIPCATESINIPVQRFAASPNSSQNSCSSGGSTYQDRFQHSRFYFPQDYYDQYSSSQPPSQPYPNLYEPEKILEINLVIFGEDDGTGFPISPSQYAVDANLYQTWLDEVNVATQQTPCQTICTQNYFGFTGLNFKINEVYFYSNSSLLNSTSDQAIMSYHLNQNPEASSQLNCIITRSISIPNAGGYATTYNHNGDYLPIIHTASNYQPSNYSSPWSWTFGYLSEHLPHEIGHHLALGHTYNSETLNQNDIDFLCDVFDNPPTYFNGCNNIMGGHQGAKHVSPKQIGRMHRSLSMFGYDSQLRNPITSSIRNCAYSKENIEDVIPYTVDNTEIWDFPLKSYQNIIVPAGATLLLKCRLEMLPNSTITVEPGGKLVLDGAVITLAKCAGKEEGEYWQGIILHGQNGAPQTAQFQGVVEVKNNSVIEFAREAIMPWEYNDWSKTGGIILAENSLFRNNNRTVQYMAYVDGSNPNGNNVGKFVNCEFIWDEDLPVSVPAPAITMNGVKGVLISGCTFHDQRTSPTSKESRATGIFTIEAGFTVVATHTSPNLPNDYTSFNSNGYDNNEFIDLYHGINVSSSSTIFPIKVDNSHFLNCFEGIHSVSQSYLSVTRNYFQINSSYNPVIVQPIQLYLSNSTNFRIDGNTFEGLHAYDPNAMIIEESGPTNHVVRSNKFINMLTGIYTIGLNRDASVSTANSTIANQTGNGLKIICNKFLNTEFSDVVVLTSDIQDGIAILQGSSGTSAGNEFTPNPAIGKSILYNPQNPTVARIDYYESLQNGSPITPGSGSQIMVRQSTVKNTCASTFGTQVADPGPLGLELGISQLESLEAAIEDLQGKAIGAQGTALAELKLAHSELLDQLISKAHQLEMSKEYIFNLLARNLESNKEMIQIEFLIQTDQIAAASEMLNNLKIEKFIVSNPELLDWIEFKLFVLNNRNGSFIEANDRIELENFKNNSTSKIVKKEASSMLCFYFNDCELASSLVYPNSQNSILNSSSPVVTLSEISPNPNDGQFTIETNSEVEIDKISATNLLGQTVDFDWISISKSKKKIQIDTVEHGTIMISILYKSGETEVKFVQIN